MRWRLFAICVVTGPLVGVVSPLVVGCAPRVEPVVLATPTASPTSARLPVLTATPMATPMAVPMPTVTPEPTPIKELEVEIETATFTIVYDNNEYDPALKAAWGFACLVEIREATLLFDTGGDGSTLLGNMDKLGFDPQVIDVVVLSHIHGDHTGGLGPLLGAGARPTVYVPAAFPASFKDDVRARTDLVEVTEPLEVLPGVYTTGEVGSGIVEQALAVETGDGLVVVTGCAHPGVVQMVRRAQEVTGGEVALVMGGFHLGGTSQGRIERIIADFRQLGVRRVAPCHCTGDLARQMFADAFGADCTLAGAGCVVIIGSG